MYDLGIRTRNGDIVYCPDSDTYIMRHKDYVDLKMMWVERLTPEIIQEMKRWELHYPFIGKVGAEDDELWDFVLGHN